MKRSSIVVLSLLRLVMLVATRIAPPPIAQPPTPSSTPTPSPISPIPMAEKIDMHCHYVPPFYRALLNSFTLRSGIAIPEWNVTAHLAMNAQLGIVTSVVSTPSSVLPADAPIDEGRTLVRQINEYGYNLTMQYPGKFLFWAKLTLPDLEGAIAEAIYALDTLGAVGVFIEATSDGELLGTPRYAPLYKVLDDRSAVVFVHPSISPCADFPVYTSNSTDIPSFIVDFLLDTTRAALNLVYRNVTVDYPNIKFLLAHSGGFLPFAATRAAEGLSVIAGNPARIPLYLARMQQFHVDLVSSATATALPSTTAFFNTSRMVYGSDYPFQPVSAIEQNTAALIGYSFGKAALRKIDYSNAYGLLKNKLKVST